MEFKNVYLIPITLFVLGVCLLLNLPLWIALIPAVIMVLGVIYKFWETGASQSAPADQQAGLKRKYLGWAINAVIILVAVWLLWSIGNNIAGTPDRIYKAEELQNLTTSGTWKLQGDELVCNGNYYTNCEIGIPNKGNIGGLTIDPGMTTLPDMDVNIGDKYLIKYYFQNLADCNGKRDGGKYHKAVLYYDGIANVNFCLDIEDNGAAEPLWIGTKYKRLLASFPGLFFVSNGYPRVDIGDWNIMVSSINAKNMEYLGGKIKVSSKKTIVIREVRITHSSYSWKELFYKTIGL